MKNNINKKIGATLLSAAIMAGTAVIPMSNAAVEAKVNNAPSIKISAHVQDIGWMDPVEAKEGNVVGTFWQSRRVEAMKFDLRNCPGVTLSIVAHVQDHGDMEFTVGAEDYDKLVGTQWEQRRMEAITIKSNGLHEQGYKLQYRAHVQDHGWLTWVEEGEMAGTRWEQRRVEAIEMRIVPISDVATAKAEAISKLNSYDKALKGTFSEATYSKLSDQITATIAEINSADSEETIAELFNAQVARIEKYISGNQTIEDIVASETKKLEEEIAKLNEKISDYVAYLPHSEYSTAEKQKVNEMINNAKAELNVATTSKEVKEIYDQLVALASAAPNIEGDSAEYKTLVKNKAAKLEEIAEYEKVLTNKTIPEDELGRVRAAIVTAKADINAAKTIDEFDAVVSEFESKVEGTTAEALAKKEITKIALSNAKADAKEAIKEYTICGYTDIETEAKDLITDIEKANTVEDVKTYVDLDSEGKIKDGCVAKDLVDDLAKAENDKKAYEAEKEKAILTLNATIEAIEDLNVDSEKANAIFEMIEIYKTNIEEIDISTTADVENAAELVKAEIAKFNNEYMQELHADIIDDVKEYQFNAEKEDALLKLEKYEDSDIESVKKLAIKAINDINDIKNVAENTGDLVANILSDTMNAIELETAKEEARILAESLIAELNQYAGYGDEYGDIAVTAADAKYQINLQLTIVEELGTLEQEKIDNAMLAMKEARKEAVDYIKTALKTNSEAIARELQEAKDMAKAELDKYIEVANTLEGSNSSLATELNSYRASVMSASNKSVVEAFVKIKLDGTLDECALKTLVDTRDSKLFLSNRVVAIDAIRKTYNDLCYETAVDGTTTVKNPDLLADSTIKAAMDKAIKNIKSKEYKNDSNVTVTVNDSEITNIKNAIIATITSANESYADLNDEKGKAIEAITYKTGDASAEKAYVETLKTTILANRKTLQSFIDEINNVKISDIPEDQTIEDYVGKIETDALTAVKNYLAKELFAAGYIDDVEDFTTKTTTVAYIKAAKAAKSASELETAVEAATTQLTATKGEANYVVAATVNTAIKTELDAIAAATVDNYKTVISTNVSVATLNKVKASIIDQLKTYVDYDGSATVNKKAAVDAVNFGTITASTTTDSLIQIALNAKAAIDDVKD